MITKNKIQRSIFHFFYQIGFYCGLTRYLLAVGMMYYGFTKIMNTQFVILPTTVWLTPLESLAGKNITWAFLGFSSWFQTLLGLLEFVPAFFLLFRRTAFVGAIFLLPLTLSVTLINFALQLWPQTQIISSVFLGLNIAVLCFEYNKITTILKLIFPAGIKLKWQSLEIFIGVLVAVTLVFYCYGQLVEYKNDSNQLTGAWFDKEPIEWTMVYKVQNDSIVLGEYRKLYFMPFGMLEEHDGSNRSFNEKYYEFDETKNTLTFKLMDNDSLVNQYNVQLLNDTLKLQADSINSFVYIKRQINGN
jgi:hypothetical protein